MIKCNQLEKIMEAICKANLTRIVSSYRMEKEFFEEIVRLYPCIKRIDYFAYLNGKKFVLMDKSSNVVSKFFVNDFELLVLDNEENMIKRKDYYLDYGKIQKLWTNMLQNVDKKCYNDGLKDYSEDLAL